MEENGARISEVSRMLDPSLINVCVILGIGLYTASFTLFKIFRESVNNYAALKILEILDSEEINELADMVADKTIDFKIIKNFYGLALESESPKKLLHQSWIFSAFSGTCFIIAAIFGNIDVNIINQIASAGLVYGIGLFMLSFYSVIKLVMKIQM